MKGARPAQRYLGLGVLLAMAGLAAIGYLSVRRDIENLRVISQNNILWVATQIEGELLRFQLSVARLGMDGTPDALDAARERFDILWSSVFLADAGRVGDLMQRHDQEHGSIPRLQTYLRQLDPALSSIAADDGPQVRRILGEMAGFQREMRSYTLRVARGDTAATALVRDRIQSSAQTTMIICLAAVLLSVLALALILRENRRQREVVELNRRVAFDAEMASRAKSRLLTMMSHELRNPLNGVLGRLALLAQNGMAARHQALVEQARRSGRTMTQMISSLLDYGEMQDGSFELRVGPLQIAALAAGVEADLTEAGSQRPRVRLRPNLPARVRGDLDRLRDVFVHLAEYVLEGGASGGVEIVLGHADETLIGDICFSGDAAAVQRKFNLLTGASELTPDNDSSAALRPLVARGIIAQAKGALRLVHGEEGRRSIRVSIPAPAVCCARLRVRLETRSAALAAIYRAALRSERIDFVGPEDVGPLDMVLVDATSIEEERLMTRLRARYGGALFVSLGPPQGAYRSDEVMEGPLDLTRLRENILGRQIG